MPFLQLDTGRLVAAYGLLAFAAAYNAGLAYLLVRAPHLLANGFIPILADGLANAGFVTIVGGFSTPAYFVLFTVTISAAMRYGYGPAFAIAAGYVGLDYVEQIARAGHLVAPDSGYPIRSGFLLITALLSGYLRQQAVTAYGELQSSYDELERAHQELQRTQTKLVETERLRAIGEMASGIAHDFNNTWWASSGGPSSPCRTSSRSRCAATSRSSSRPRWTPRRRCAGCRSSPASRPAPRESSSR